VKLPLRAVLAGLALLAATPATAATIHVETTTQVGTGIFGTYASLFTTGEAVRIRYSYDDTVPDSNPASGAGTFSGAVLALSAEFLDSGLAFFFEGGPVNSIIASDNTGNFSDSFAVGAIAPVAGSLLAGAELISITASFATVVIPGPPVLVVNQRPSLPPFSYLSGQLSMGTSEGSVAMTLVGGNGVAGVPEPGAAPLLAAALAALGALRRGRATS
jgi:hypothetical protein